MPMLPPRAAVALSVEALDRLVGEYALTPAMALTITRDGNALYAQATGQSRFLSPRDYPWLRGAAPR